MLIPLPGHSHLKVLQPGKPETARETDTIRTRGRTDRPPVHRRIATGLTVLALEAAFGMRPARALDDRRFDATVRSYVTAHLRRRRDRGPVRLDSLHLRADARGAEVFGSCTVAGTTRGFTARLDGPDRSRPERYQWRMRTFRVLS